MNYVLQAFADATLSNGGPIIELGCGFGSTGMLHKICEATKRRLVSVETDPEWLKMLEHFKTPWHEFYLVSEDKWDQFRMLEQFPWDLALVDNKPGHYRYPLTRRLSKVAQYVAQHDTEQPGNDDRFKYKYSVDYRRERPWTTVMSEFRDPRLVLES